MLDPDISTADALRHLSFDEEPTAAALDRRRFLRLVGMGVGAGVVAGGSGSLLDHAFGHDPSAWAAGPIGADDGVLVIIGMYGGNDGLNTVVPFTDPNYVE
ncbi:MAG: twin-arginine translocation signal domain-containing protein, partial [Ilumatobacter fluminis]